MSMPSLNSARPLADAVSKIGTYVAVAALLGFLVLGVVISPVAFSAVGAADRDWGRLSTIGQALQRHQVRHERLTLVRDMHLSVVGTALDDPEYCQCWGARVAGDDMDERLFYYTSSILTLWWYAYEIGDLRDEQVRSYGRGMFESEVPREYWRMHGRWRLSGVRTRRHRRFLLIIDEAFQEAEASGPPVRRRERARSPRPRAARRAPARPGKGLRRRLR
jgi:hypothetical protein